MLFEHLVDDPPGSRAASTSHGPRTSWRNRRSASSTSCAATRASSCTSSSCTATSRSSRCVAATSSCCTTRRRSSPRRPTTSQTSTTASTAPAICAPGPSTDRSRISARARASPVHTHRGRFAPPGAGRGSAAHCGRAARPGGRDDARAGRGGRANRGGGGVSQRRVVIAGAAGRDFHNFNVVYRGRDDVQVVAFRRRRSRHRGAGLPGRVRRDQRRRNSDPPGGAAGRRRSARERDEVVFAYSDVTHEHVIHVGSTAMAAGADYTLGPRATMIPSEKPVVAVCAVRTGSGRARRPIRRPPPPRSGARRRPAPSDAVRRPDAAGSAALRALRRPGRGRLHDRGAREYEPHLAEEPRLCRHRLCGHPLARRAGGGRDRVGRRQQRRPFIKPDLHSLSATRIARVTSCATTLVRRTCAWRTCVVNKTDTARRRGRGGRSTRSTASTAGRGRSRRLPFHVEDGRTDDIRGKRVLAVEDGPTLTHGEMTYGAAVLAAKQHGAAALVDPRGSPSARSRERSRRIRTSASSSRRWATGASRWRS